MFNPRNKHKKFRKFDYSRKKLENPFFKREEKISKRSNLKIKIIIIIIIIIFCFAFWFFYFSNFYKITEISIEGLNRVPTEEIYALTEEKIRSNKFFIIPQNTLLLFNENKFSKSLKDKYRFEEIIVNKNWPHGLEIKIKEKPFACIWNEDDKYYYTDSDGFILEEINPLDIKNKKYPIIHNKSDKKIADFKIQVEKEYLEHAKYLFEKINNNSLGINIRKFILDNNIDTIKIETEEGTEISFSTKNDLEKQIKKLITIKQEKLKDDFNNKTHIDLRFGDKIYYQ